MRRSFTEDNWPLLFVCRSRTGLCDQGFGVRGLTGCREILTHECLCWTCGLMQKGDPKRKPLQPQFIRTALWTTIIYKKIEFITSRPALPWPQSEAECGKYAWISHPEGLGICVITVRLACVFYVFTIIQKQPQRWDTLGAMTKKTYSWDVLRRWVHSGWTAPGDIALLYFNPINQCGDGQGWACT